MSDDEYYTIRSEGIGNAIRHSRPKPLRVAILFSSAVIALALLTVPELSRRQNDADLTDTANSRFSRAIDPIVTGTLRTGENAPQARGVPGIDRSGTPRPGSTYVVRRSVLNGGSVCIMSSDGTRDGAC